jgi:hypothetical protein
MATKEALGVHSIISCESENVSLIDCGNAEGNFMPPVLVLKGVREKKKFSDGLARGSKMYMNKKSLCTTLI